MCDNSWSETDANIVCKQLGFSPTGTLYQIHTKSKSNIYLINPFRIYHFIHTYIGARPQPGSVFSDVSRPLYLEIPVCSGDELSLVDCHRDLGHTCNHTSDVGVRCEGTHLEYPKMSLLSITNTYVVQS